MLSSTPLTASVRPIGSVGPYAPRAFTFMLGSRDTVLAQRREAARILRQIGYEHRGPINLAQEA